MKIIWKEEYSVGVIEIDNQHIEFISLINKIYDVIEDGDNKKEACAILDSLADYALYHFETEEELFKKFNYEKASEHMKEHEQFRAKVIKWASTCPSSEDRLPILKEAADFIGEWLISHILGTDKQYMECFSEHGLS